MPPGPQRFGRFLAEPGWRAIDLLSDVHLQPEQPRTFEAWRDHLLGTPADAVLMLGDLFEVWVGDDSRHAGFEARCAEVLADASTRRTVAFMCGNRDFLVGSTLLKECGVLALPDPTVLVAFGERLLLAHGDALCLSDLDYQRFRAVVRSPAWQSDFLARPLEERRALARGLRDRSEERKAAQPSDAWFDIDTATAARWMHEAATPTLIHGHTHRPAVEGLAPGYTRHVLSDWDLDHAGVARAEVLRLRRAGLGVALTREAPSV